MPLRQPTYFPRFQQLVNGAPRDMGLISADYKAQSQTLGPDNDFLDWDFPLRFFSYSRHVWKTVGESEYKHRLPLIFPEDGERKNIQNRLNPEPQCLVTHDFITSTAARRSWTVIQMNVTHNTSISLQRRSLFVHLTHRRWTHSSKHIQYALIQNTNFQGN